MNREIKFRIWLPDLKKMEYKNFGIYNGKIVGVSKPGIDSHSDKFKFLEIDDLQIDYIIQQFTGLTDKNGKEIYEGDLINFTLRGEVHGPESEDIKGAEVWYNAEDAMFNFGRYKTNDLIDYSFCLLDRIDKKSIEIIGNIFENKELLK